MKRLFIPLTTSVAILSGCGTIPSDMAKGNVIVVARFDSRLPGGGPQSGITTNASGVPSLVAGAAGVTTSPAGGTVLNITTGWLLSAIADAVNKGKVLMAFKYIQESNCEFASRIVDLNVSPYSQELFPGYIARFDTDSADNRLIVPVKTNNEQRYLTTSHPCYSKWVEQVQRHQRVLANKLAWNENPFAIIGAPSVESYPVPKYDWIK